MTQPTGPQTHNPLYEPKYGAPALAAPPVTAPAPSLITNPKQLQLTKLFRNTLAKAAKGPATSFWGKKISLGALRTLLPGGIGSYVFTGDSLTTSSRMQFQDNPLIHASIAQMMIEIHKLDEILLKQGQSNTTGIQATISESPSGIHARVSKAVEKSIGATIEEHKELQQNAIIATVAETIKNNPNIIESVTENARSDIEGVLQATVTEGTDANAPVHVGFEKKPPGPDPKFGFELDPKDQGTLKFHGNAHNSSQKTLDHNHQEPLVKAFSYLAEMLLIILMNAAKAKAEATFDHLALMYQQRVMQLIDQNRSQEAANYLNTTLGDKSAFDPTIKKALRQALGLPNGHIDDKKLTVSKERYLCYDGTQCKGTTAKQIHLGEQRGPVTYKIVGTPEELTAVKFMNKYTTAAPLENNSQSKKSSIPTVNANVHSQATKP